MNLATTNGRSQRTVLLGLADTPPPSPTPPARGGNVLGTDSGTRAAGPHGFAPVGLYRRGIHQLVRLRAIAMTSAFIAGLAITLIYIGRRWMLATAENVALRSEVASLKRQLKRHRAA